MEEGDGRGECGESFNNEIPQNRDEARDSKLSSTYAKLIAKSLTYSYLILPHTYWISTRNESTNLVNHENTYSFSWLTHLPDP